MLTTPIHAFLISNGAVLARKQATIIITIEITKIPRYQIVFS